jgi:hypothetical protein
MKNSEFNVYTAEKFMIPSEFWTEEIMDQFPEDIRKELEYGEIPTGIGHHNQLGWFVTASAGQGPCLVWSEKGETEKEEFDEKVTNDSFFD